MAALFTLNTNYSYCMEDANSDNSVMALTIDNYHVWRENTNLNTDERNKKIYDYLFGSDLSRFSVILSQCNTDKQLGII